MGIGLVPGGRITLARHHLQHPQPCCTSSAWQQPSWLSCPPQECTLRRRSREVSWGRAWEDASSPSSQRAALDSRQNVQDTETMRAPADLFQSALSALDLYHPAASIKSEVIDDPDDIAVQQGQTAATVGRAIYEVNYPRDSQNGQYAPKVVPAERALLDSCGSALSVDTHQPAFGAADVEAKHSREDKTYLRQAEGPAAS